ncbi:hypothetical protein EON65_47835 [archaeon]|nr:MAG: hypothetical protein EON65_47835 [archaeon]
MSLPTPPPSPPSPPDPISRYQKVQQLLVNCSRHHLANTTMCRLRKNIMRLARAKDSKWGYVDATRKILFKLRNCTCNDGSMLTSVPIDRYELPFPPTPSTSASERAYTSNVHLNMFASKIWSVDNFITIEDCNTLI